MQANLGAEKLEPRMVMAHGIVDVTTLDPQGERFVTSHENIYNFGQNPTTETVQEGLWSDPSTWSNGVPGDDDVVQVHHTVLYDLEVSGGRIDAINLNPGSILSFMQDKDTHLEVGTLTVLWDSILAIGTDESPIQDHVDAKITFLDQPLDPVNDPLEHGGGLIVIQGLYITNGTDRTPHAELLAQDGNVITVNGSPEGWQAGDQLWFPDTNHTAHFTENEYATIASVEGDTITLQDDLQHHHVTDTFNSHVAHLSSNITLTSENPEGTRGHVMFLEGAIVVAQDAVYDDLGRTTVEPLGEDNQIGRYSFHMHRLAPNDLADPDGQFFIHNNVFTDGLKWGLAIHDTHYGVITDNVIVNVEGAGLVFEDGSETGSRVLNNFSGLNIGSGEGPFSRAVGTVDNGHEGTALWMRGSNHAEFAGNIGVNATYAGQFVWSRFGGDAIVPARPGADKRIDPDYIDTGAMTNGSIHDNILYNNANGLSLFGVGQDTKDYFPLDSMELHNNFQGVVSSYSGKFQFTNINLHRDEGVASHGSALALDNVTKFTGDNIQSTGYGGVAWHGGDFVLSNSSFEGAIGLAHSRPNQAEFGTTPVDTSKVILDNVHTSGVRASYGPAFVRMDGTWQYDVYVFNHNGDPDANYQLFAPQQVASYVQPTSTSQRLNPVEGNTNQENWDLYRMAPKGRLAPSDATTQEGFIDGTLVVPIAPDRDIDGPVISGAHYHVISPTEVLVHWFTDEPATTQLEWGHIPRDGYGNLTEVDTELTTEHFVTLTGLTPGSTYHYIPRSHDANGNASDSPFWLGGFSYVAHPLNTDHTVQARESTRIVDDITHDGATFTVMTNVPSTAQVFVRRQSDNVTVASFTSDTLSHNHTVELTGLPAATPLKVYAKLRNENNSGLNTGWWNFYTRAETLTTPEVTGIIADSGSSVRAVHVNFSEDVVLSEGAITITRIDGTPVEFDLVHSGSTSTITFSQGVYGSIADGRYTIAVHSHLVTSAAGVDLLEDATHEFFRLYGDADGDGDVDRDDILLGFIPAFQGEYRNDLDYDNNGVMDYVDYLALLAYYGLDLNYFE